MVVGIIGGIGGAFAIAASLFKLAVNVGRMTQLLDDHEKRIIRLESWNDRRHP
jgi:hypothetical protein